MDNKNINLQIYLKFIHLVQTKIFKIINNNKINNAINDNKIIFKKK